MSPVPLPARSAAFGPEHPLESISDSLKGVHAVLVLADAADPLGLAAQLSAWGMRVLGCVGAQAAVQTLHANVPDVLLLEVGRLELDAAQVCQALRATPGLAQLPLLFLLDGNQATAPDPASHAGASDFINRSAPAPQLRGRLCQLLRSAQAQQALVRDQARLAWVQELALVGGFDWRVRPGRSLASGLALSTEAQQLLGGSPEQPLGLRALLRCMTAAERQALLAKIRVAAASPAPVVWDLPMSLAPRRHTLFHVEAMPEFTAASQFAGYSGLIQDQTDRHSAEHRIQRLAQRDPLTELPNWRQMQARAEQAVEAARRNGHGVALLLIDLDRFKKVNDNLGHAAGDELLIEVALRLRNCLRHVDQFPDATQRPLGERAHRRLESVGRLGGDEFIALLPDVSSEIEAQRVALRMLESLEDPVQVAGQDLFATASIGLAMYPQDGECVPDLMRHADLAMSAAKERGRNTFLRYSARLSARGVERLVMESDLHKALQRNELRLYYQPKIDTRTRQLVGVEALMRWQRADGLRSPLDFIPLAEETGLIVALSDWALFEAARQAARWREEFGWNQSVAVNLPSRMFGPGTELPERLAQATRQANIPLEWLVLEVTESSLMKDIHEVLPVLHRLSRMGVQLSVDDFGTGYSSLHYLTELPISELKIDRSFVGNMTSKPKSLDVIHLIISLARSMNLRVVAEGVEEIGQLARLRSMDCDVVQGYLFSRPMAGHELAAWIHSQFRSVPRRRSA